VPDPDDPFAAMAAGAERMRAAVDAKQAAAHPEALLEALIAVDHERACDDGTWWNCPAVDLHDTAARNQARAMAGWLQAWGEAPTRGEQEDGLLPGYQRNVPRHIARRLNDWATPRKDQAEKENSA
jgi:hypothetical protein